MQIETKGQASGKTQTVLSLRNLGCSRGSAGTRHCCCTPCTDTCASPQNALHEAAPVVLENGT